MERSDKLLGNLWIALKIPQSEELLGSDQGTSLGEVPWSVSVRSLTF